MFRLAFCSENNSGLAFTQDMLAFRSELINKLLLLVAVASLFEVVILLSHVPTLGITPYFIVRMTLIAVLWLFIPFLFKISYLGRISLFIGITWISIVAHLVQFGPAMNAKSILIILTFFAMLFVSERAGWLVVASVVAIFAVLGSLVTQGYLVHHFDYQAHILKPQTWVGITFFLTAYSAITGYVAMQFLRFLHRLLIKSREQAKQLHEAKEKIEAANRAKQQFLSNMSHELNTPLHSLLGHLQLLRETKLSQPQYDHLEQLQKNTDYLHHLINAVLDTSRLEHHQIVLNPTPCVLVELLNHVAELTKTKTDHKGLYFEYLLSQFLPSEILIDGIRLRQILLNLLNNAIKYTPEGYVRFTVTQLKQHPEQAILQFSVCDSGIGIPLEEQARLLQPFERGNTLDQGGAGLGLSISQQLLQQMNSKLEISSSPQGSCFQFQLTVEVLQQTTCSITSPEVPDFEILQNCYQHLLFGRFSLLKQHLEQLGQDNHYSFFVNQSLKLINTGNRTDLQTFFSSFFPKDVSIPRLTDYPTQIDPKHPQLLIIDDDNLNVHLIAHYLRDFEFDLLSANNGREGLQLAQYTHPQLILLDIYMPSMTGFEVCQQLKSNEKLKNIPVIFFTASSKPEDIAIAFKNQGQDYILKPSTEEEVITRITTHLQRSTLHYPLINRLIAYRIRQDEILETIEQNPSLTNIIEKLYLVQELLLKNLQQTPSLDDLAQQVGLNRNKLNEKFKVLFGNTIFVWLREQRLQFACNLLKETDLSVQIIAEQIGCTSQSQFSRLFKQRFGQAPREYRISQYNQHDTVLLNNN